MEVRVDTMPINQSSKKRKGLFSGASPIAPRPAACGSITASRTTAPTSPTASASSADNVNLSAALTALKVSLKRDLESYAPPTPAVSPAHGRGPTKRARFDFGAMEETETEPEETQKLQATAPLKPVNALLAVSNRIKFELERRRRDRERAQPLNTTLLSTPFTGTIMNPVVVEAEARTQSYLPQINDASTSIITSLDAIIKELPSFRQIKGKVRDVYVFEDRVLLVSTDRQSAFDRALASVPFKGRVLTLTSVWWFEQTKHIVANHLLGVPHPSAMLCKKCTVFPVEFVVRGYITGSTSTSMWTNYKNGSRDFCGHKLQDGYVQHQKLPQNLVTPTTKDDEHDELISGLEIVSQGRMTQEQWDYCEKKTLELFAFGQEQAAKRGLILVDTKYEFGIDDATGEIMLIDEIHTPDSSRFWLAASYEERMAAGQSPENIDKEFLRLWFKDHCDPYKDEVLPEAPKELVSELSRRYILLYELITGSKFEFPSADEQGLAEGVCKTLLSK
ncbi:hypothetical protein BBO99_00007149 [Phytophthora kernoviae]|uniref:Phosphoribosylaminoimidazole-succinocarboxamide synthase, chloroplastic n=2 Tax=Phytophthora kernoviae TaxID=325452 RepID=A0A3R7MSI3_9STRA|nr:hypothetical protein G195_008024 [Phytophthora kernoviae 00238/432]KAG2520392.1 hypothetical protein JM16_006401 [Phytophthora kernoviae]KAG2521421.1 hypothetical protein JM18_006628 [Phytophthora kernoviae]RLN31680.1 hypothetical protein BBI17_007116 [Phytophthora kernoviae]RLN76942.1 hypothetical protein BBO99_00007149 [Phytophthora kernoviae]